MPSIRCLHCNTIASSSTPLETCKCGRVMFACIARRPDHLVLDRKLFIQPGTQYEPCPHPEHACSCSSE